MNPKEVALAEPGFSMLSLHGKVDVSHRVTDHTGEKWVSVQPIVPICKAMGIFSSDLQTRYQAVLAISRKPAFSYIGRKKGGAVRCIASSLASTVI